MNLNYMFFELTMRRSLASHLGVKVLALSVAV